MLEALGIGCRAGDRWLLKHVSLSVRPGRRLAITGPSGGGKTLLLRSLALLDPLDVGEIHWRGRPIRGHEVPAFRSRVIYLHQRPTLVEGTVEDNLRQPLSLHIHRKKSFNRSRIVHWLASLGRRESFLSKAQRDLSGGESQITALLRAMQLNPDVLLLDEPTAALDAEATNAVESLVHSWLGENSDTRATVWVSHDGLQASRIADEILHMREGHLGQE